MLFSGKQLTDQDVTAPNIPGYKYIGLLGGWIFNCRNVETTFQGITLKFLYSKEF